MIENQSESLAGQGATIKPTTGDSFFVTFGPDVQLTWASGSQISVEPTKLFPEINGHLETKDDYSNLKNAELILDDGYVFKISFQGPNFFYAHLSIDSRNFIDLERP